MSQSLFKNQYAAVPETVRLYAKINIGGTGAPTLVAASSTGISSVTRNSAGNYTIVLQDPMGAFLQANFMYLESTSRDLTFQVLAEDVATAANKTLQFVVHAAATATDPTSGGIVYVEIIGRRSAAG